MCIGCQPIKNDMRIAIRFLLNFSTSFFYFLLRAEASDVSILLLASWPDPHVTCLHFVRIFTNNYNMFGASSGGTGLFGQNKSTFGSAAAPQPQGSLFGGSNTANSAATGTSSSFSFGQNNTAGGTGQTAPTTGGLFGSAQNLNVGANPGQQAAGFGSGGGLFGSTNNNANNATGTSAFGKPSGGFGASTNNNTGAASGGLFGLNTAQSGNTSGAPGGGLFANSNTGANTNTNTNTSGSLFGGVASLAASNAAAGQTQNSGLFLNTASGGLFGSAASQPAQSGGLFSQAKPATTGGLFNQQQTQNNQAQPQAQNSLQTQPQSLFGGTSNNAQPSFSWSGAGTSTNTQNKAFSPSTSQQTLAQKSSSKYTPAVNDQLTKIKEQWNPASPKCAFKTHVYNKFTEQEMAVLMQQPRPSDETPEDWDAAMAARPSELYYPVKISSFSEVAQRVEVQLDHVAKSRVVLNSINEKLLQLSAKHDLDNLTRIQKARLRHTRLLRRLLRLATVLAVLKLRGYPLLPEEEEISRELQQLNARVTDPSGSVGNLSDLYARLAILKGRSEELSSQMDSSIRVMNGGYSNVSGVEAENAANVDQVVDRLTQLLYKQQVGLNYLNDVLQDDLEKADSLQKQL